MIMGITNSQPVEQTEHCPHGKEQVGLNYLFSHLNDNDSFYNTFFFLVFSSKSFRRFVLYHIFF